MKKQIQKVAFLIILTIILIANFSTNFLGKKNADIEGKTFETFQNDSEYLVFSEILQDKYKKETNKYGLAEVLDKENIRVDNIWNEIKNYNEEKVIKDYISQFGLQGHIFSFLYNKLHVPFWGLKLICCTALAIVIVAICYYLSKKYNKLMGAIFYIIFLLSPWVVAFARNLYWVEFTWFLPILFGLIISINYSNKKILIPCIFVSILIKCLCGYEYITTIMLATISFFIVDFFMEKEKKKKIDILKTIIIVGICCLLAFGVALCIHAVLRGEGNLLEGIKNIYKEDVLRRTIIVSDKVQFPEVYKKSLDAGIKETVAKYFEWHTDIIIGIKGEYFNLILISSIVIMIYNALKKEKNCYNDITMFIVFFITTLSWYVLGKSHSYIHTTMNYVLWYFGFIQINLYIITKFVCQKIYSIGRHNG